LPESGLCSHFANFALQLLDYFFSFQWFNFQSVEHTGCSELQLNMILHSFDQTVFSTCAGRHEFLMVNDFSRQVITSTFSAILVTVHVIICFGNKKHAGTGTYSPNALSDDCVARAKFFHKPLMLQLAFLKRHAMQHG